MKKHAFPLGGDDSIHHRVGEAEKSHQRARIKGFFECWTVVNVDNIDRAMARKESPSTNHLYWLAVVLSEQSSAWEDLRRRLVSYIGIPLIP